MVQSFNVASVRPSEVVLSPDGSKLYSAGTDGILRVYSLQTGALIHSWQVGTKLGGLDLSPDGSFLMVAERQPLAGSPQSGQTTITVYKVDTANGQTTSYPYQATGLDSVFFDVAVLSNGMVLLSQDFAGSGWVALKLLNPATGQYTLGAQVRQSSVFTPTPDGTKVLIGEPNISNAQIDIYQTGSGIVAGGNGDGFSWGIQAFTNSGSLAANYIYNAGILIYNSTLQLQTTLQSSSGVDWRSGRVTDLAFDPSGQHLFVLDNMADSIVQLRTSDWGVVTSIPVNADVGGWAGTIAASFGSRLIVDPYSRYFSVATDTGLVLVANPNAPAMEGTAGADVLNGTLFDDVINGHGGDDLILSGTGTDQLSGGANNDRLYFGADFGGSDLAAGGDGFDQLLLQGNYPALTLAGANISSIEHIRLLSAANSSIVTAPGGSFSYSITVADSLVSGTDMVTIEGLTLGVGETLTFDGSAETSGRFAVFGGAGADVIRTGPGNDILNGGGGDDILRGGPGDDEYAVDDAGDVIEENAGEGTDGVVTNLAVFSLFGTHIENLLANNDVNHDFRGSAGDNSIIGAAGNDFIRLMDGGDDVGFGADGNDVFLLGATLTAADLIDGGAGIDQIALQGDYAGAEALVLGENMVSIENIAILPGNDTRFGDPGTNFYSYEFTLQNEAVAAGVQLVVDANRLRPGEDFTFNGSAETDGSFFIYGGGGTDILTGGARNDVFIFGGQNQWGASDVVTGGAGIDQLALRGNYTIVFGAGQLVGIEQIAMVSAQDTRYGALGSSYSYNLTLVDANVDGIQMTIDAAPLRPGETLTFNGSAEDDGSFRVFGGRGNDTIVGSQNGDIIAGRLGQDSMTGNGGADTFRFDLVEESAPGAADHILDFTPGSDKIDLSRIDANTHAEGNQAFTWIGSDAFGTSGAASAGQLRAYESNGSWFVEGDTDGNGAADFVLQLTLAGPAALGQGDFLL